MKEFLAELMTVKWWVSVFLVGILVNFISEFLQTRFGRWSEMLAGWRKRRSERLQKMHARWVEEMTADPSMYYTYLFTEIRVRIGSVALLLLTSGMAAVAIVTSIRAESSGNTLPKILTWLSMAAFIAMSVHVFRAMLRCNLLLAAIREVERSRRARRSRAQETQGELADS